MTKEEIIKIAQKVTGVSFPLGIDGISIGMNEKHLQDFANAIAATEREACAKVCEAIADDAAKEQDFHTIGACELCADEIRARGEA
jgi:hypothetical protein